jgi:hypothetical protein
VVLVGFLRVSDPNDDPSQEWDTRSTVVLNLRTLLGIPWYIQVYLEGISEVYRVYLVSHFDIIRCSASHKVAFYGAYFVPHTCLEFYR